MRHILFILSLAAGLLLSSCGGGGGGPTVPSYTPEQIAQFEAASQHITDVLVQADDPFSPEALEAAKQTALAQSIVELAVVDEDDLIVKYKNGGFEIWAGDLPRMLSPADIAFPREMAGNTSAETRSLAAPVGTRNAVLIFAQYDDPVYELYKNEASPKDAFAQVGKILQARGFSVTELYGDDASIANLKQLSEDSVIVQLGHGGLWRTNPNPYDFSLPEKIYCVQTGQEPGLWAGFLGTFSADWWANRVIRMSVPWGKGDGDDVWTCDDEKIREKSLKHFLAVTDRFWAHYYQNKHFKNGLFLNLACESSAYPNYRDALFSVGIEGYTGWSDIQSVSPYAAWWMLAEMAVEKTLQQAYEVLPYSLKHEDRSDECGEGGSWEANLWVGKDEGLNLTLGGPIIQGPEITITSPEDGASITTRTCIVEGKITPWQSDESYATISVNGMSNALPVDDEGNFSHEVGLRAGNNTIRVLVVAIAISSKEILVIGDFEPDIFWSQLSWNTDWNDIDLHLAPESGEDECYYGNKVTFWGAELDVDDVNGYGPEHITARSLPAGKYLLYVHYYDTHGQTIPAVVTVKVSVNGGQIQVYTLPAITTAAHAWWDGEGDFWSVCYVSYPAGTIETIDQYFPGGRTGQAASSFLSGGKIDLSK